MLPEQRLTPVRLRLMIMLQRVETLKGNRSILAKHTVQIKLASSRIHLLRVLLLPESQKNRGRRGPHKRVLLSRKPQPILAQNLREAC